MGSWLLGRLPAFVLTLLLASFLVYVVTVRLPGDPALALFRARYGDAVTPVPEQVEAIRREAGFDRPLPLQYGRWLGAALRGDFGRSYTLKRQVMPMLLERLPVTLVLSAGSVALALLLSIPLAVVAGRWRVPRRIVFTLTQGGISVPEYFLALVLVLVFAVRLRVFPVAGWGSVPAAVLPLATLAAYPCAVFTRLILTGVDENLRTDWARTARAKGLSENVLRFRHILPHALLPVVSLVGVAMSGALSSALVAEVIFAIPGVSRLLFDAIQHRDIPVVQACLVVQVSLAVLANTLADLSLRQLNPMLKVTDTAGHGQ